MTIKINDKEIELKYSLRSLLMFENITEKTFNPQGLTDIITFFYCVVLTSSNDYTYKYNDFITLLDENPEYLDEFGKWVVDVAENSQLIQKN